MIDDCKINFDILIYLFGMDVGYFVELDNIVEKEN